MLGEDVSNSKVENGNPKLSLGSGSGKKYRTGSATLTKTVTVKSPMDMVLKDI